jgi:hypothetical protein
VKKRPAAQIRTGRAAPTTAATTAAADEDDLSDLTALLSAHNKKVKPASVYVPAMHSVKEIREVFDVCNFHTRCMIWLTNNNSMGGRFCFVIHVLLMTFVIFTVGERDGFEMARPQTSTAAGRQ